MKLSDLEIGQEAKIQGFNSANKEMKRHLLDMGLTKGTTVTMMGKAPMGDPITIQVRGYKLSIGNSSFIDVQPIGRQKGNDGEER